jgi:hypothetical protein
MEPRSESEKRTVQENNPSLLGWPNSGVDGQLNESTGKPSLTEILLQALARGIPEFSVKNTRCMWAGATFFQLCCCVSFRFWREIGFGLHTYVLRIQYSCGVVLVFWLRWDSFWCYVHTYCTIQLCSCVSFLVVAGNSSQNENTFLQKNYWVTLL